MRLYKISFFLLWLCFSIVHALDVPTSVDREQTAASLQYTVSYTDGGALKENWQIVLDGNGTLQYTGLYLGSTSQGCSYLGGRARLPITKEAHSTLMIDAISAVKENEKPLTTSGPRTSPSNSYPRLLVELGNEAKLVELARHEKATKEFQDKIALIVNSLATEKKIKSKFLEYSEKRDFKSRAVQATLKNAGTDNLKFDLPKNAGDHFFLQMGDGAIRELSYGKKPTKLTYELKPGQEVKVDLTIPNDIAPSSGLVVFENFSDRKAKKTAQRVRLCAIGTDGKRRF